MSGVLIRQVENRRDLKVFVQVPWRIFRDDPNWVPPLIMERMDVLKENKNPFFQHAEAGLWVAYKHGEPVGRISAQVDSLVEKIHGARIGHFGFFDCVDDQAVAASLLDTALHWLRTRGMTEVMGPFSLSINEEAGMLVDGFDTPPSLMMGHARPYYQYLLTRSGLGKVKDVWAYYLDISRDVLPPAINRLVERTLSRKNVTIRPIDMQHYDRDVKTILDIFNDAWRDNWQFLPFTDGERQQMARDMKLLVREDFTYIAAVDGVPQAMMVTLPNLNEIIADMNGRLFPVGIFKLLWRLKIRPSFKTVRVPLMGVRKEIQNSHVGGALAFALIESCRRSAAALGCTHAELSWVLEDNTRLAKMLETIGCRKYKTYRLFAMPL